MPGGGEGFPARGTDDAGPLKLPPRPDVRASAADTSGRAQDPEAEVASIFELQGQRLLTFEQTQRRLIVDVEPAIHLQVAAVGILPDRNLIPDVFQQNLSVQEHAARAPWLVNNFHDFTLSPGQTPRGRFPFSNTFATMCDLHGRASSPVPLAGSGERDTRRPSYELVKGRD